MTIEASHPNCHLQPNARGWRRPPDSAKVFLGLHTASHQVLKSRVTRSHQRPPSFERQRYCSTSSLGRPEHNTGRRVLLARSTIYTLPVRRNARSVSGINVLIVSASRSPKAWQPRICSDLRLPSASLSPDSVRRARYGSVALIGSPLGKDQVC